MKKDKETTVEVATAATEGTAPVATVETASNAATENGAAEAEAPETVEETQELVKVVVKQLFRDKFTPTIYYKVGQELEFDAERAENLVSRGLVEYAKAVE